MDEQRVTVEIFGQTYTIQGDAPPEYIQKLAAFVNRKMEEVHAGSSSITPLQAAILVSMNIADEYHQLKKIRNSEEGQLEARTRALISMLDEGLIGDAFSLVKTD